jgi:hypothetical protein
VNRSIAERLKKLETLMVPEAPLRRWHFVPARTDAERDAAIAELIGEGASPDDVFVELVPFSRCTSKIERGKTTWT